MEEKMGDVKKENNIMEAYAVKSIEETSSE